MWTAKGTALLVAVASLEGPRRLAVDALEVAVSVTASWPAAPLAAELLEGLAEVGLGRSYLRTLASKASATDAAGWRDVAAQAAEAQLAHAADSMAGRFISLRARHGVASPRIEASRNLERADRQALIGHGAAGDCAAAAAWAVVASSPSGAAPKVACTPEALAALAKQLPGRRGSGAAAAAGDGSWAPLKTPLDHVLYEVDEQDPDAIQAIGYAALDEPSLTAQLLGGLAALADALDAEGRPGRVVFRHGPGAAAATGAPLAGFGMELLARSADEVTKSVDDGGAAAAPGAGGAGAGSEGGCSNATGVIDPVEGFHGIDLGMLAKRHPDASSALCKLRGDLRASVESPAPPWELKRLGAHAALRAVKAAAGDGGGLAGLAALYESASDFPAGWAKALAAGGIDEEGAAREALEQAERLPKAGQFEVNGWRVPLHSRSPLQVMQSQAPLFRATELLARVGFNETQTASILRDSRPRPPQPTKIDVGDPRLPAEEGGPRMPRLYDVLKDPTTKKLRESERNQNHPALLRLGQLYGRQFGYPPPIPRALVGVGLVLDPCDLDHVIAAQDLVAGAPPLTVGVVLSSSTHPKTAAYLRGALLALGEAADGPPWSPIELLVRFAAASDSSGICAKGAKARIRKAWEELWQKAKKPVPEIKSDETEDFSPPGGLMAPSAVINGNLISGSEALEKGILAQMCKDEVENLVRSLQWGMGPELSATDEQVADWQYFGSVGKGQRAGLLRQWHPVLTGERASAARYVPLAPAVLTALPGGRLSADDVSSLPGGPAVVHALLLGDPSLSESAPVSSSPAAFLRAYASHLAAAIGKVSAWEDPKEGTHRWLQVAVAGGCPHTAGAPLSPSAALRRCLAAAAPPSSAPGAKAPAALLGALKGLAGAWSEASSATDSSPNAFVEAVLKGCQQLAKAESWPAPELLDNAAAVADAGDIARCSAHADFVAAVGPVPAGAAVLWVNGRRFGPLEVSEEGVEFSAAHVSLAEDLEMKSSPRFRGPTADRLPVSHKWPSLGAAKGFAAAAAKEDPLLLVYALAVRAKAVDEALAIRRGGDENDENSQSRSDQDDDETDDRAPPAQRTFAKAPAFLRLHLKPTPGEPCPLRVFAIIDPLSQDAQRLPPLLRLLHEELNAEVGVVLKPTPLVASPLESYYRAASVAAAPGKGLAALGKWEGRTPVLRLPVPPRRGQLLSLQPLTPPSWLCSAVDSGGVDLDNLAAEGDDVVNAHFVLEALFIEGWAGNVLNRPASSRQLGLVPLRKLAAAGAGDDLEQGMAGTDSVVVKSGYFQLRAPPGLYRLDLLKGDSEDERILQPTGGVELVSLAGRATNLEVTVGLPGPDAKEAAKLAMAKERAKARQRGEDVAIDDASGGGGGSGRFEGAGGNPKKCQETVHIFSVASGHRYERLLRIMMLSVRSQTDCPLRFWLIENFLSPNFRKLLPALGEKVGFAVSRVTYKWPAWLRAQTQKQRVIWAYKILFLDVLFPSEVNRVLFIDADQIVRSDVKELWNIDLQGKVYGFVPFCGGGSDSEDAPASSWFGGSGGGKEDLRNQETLGFRFWEQGFWARHLGNRPYHISALFVVDLRRFRASSAGDILREEYQQLTSDPNSLANLDQDLPNYAQHHLPIFSLPQEWLWCESWCSEESKARAKTIDMCQNPVKKEGKLQQARRIAPEWVEYDRRLEGWIHDIEQSLASNATASASK